MRRPEATRPVRLWPAQSPSPARHKHVGDATIAGICASSNDLGKAVNGLIEQTRAGGAPDNVTAILAEIA